MSTSENGQHGTSQQLGEGGKRRTRNQEQRRRRRRQQEREQQKRGAKTQTHTHTHFSGQQQPQQQQEENMKQSSSSSSSCPFAQQANVVDFGSSEGGGDNGSGADEEFSFSSLPGLVELKECPAFSKECPFKGAKSPEEISERLQHIPPSHLQTGGVFHRALQLFHKQNPVVAGSLCPVKNSLPQGWTFDEAMEELSLVAIMGRLAQDWEDRGNKHLHGNGNGNDGDDHNGRQRDSEEEEGSTVSAGSTTASSVVASAPSTIMSSNATSVGNDAANRRLSEALKSGTAVAHEAAESVHFVKNFVRGKIDRELYGLLVAQLFNVYQHLEQALDVHAPKHFAACHFPDELYRTESLQEDMEFWHAQTPSVSPATQDYLDRIDYLSQTDPLLLLAHAYTRYLGDLSGGKVLARVARRALQLDDNEGLSFYQFPKVKSFKLFKDQYRNCLNQLPLSSKQVNDVVQEANVAFLLNMRLFEELDVKGGVPGAQVRTLESVYAIIETKEEEKQTTTTSANDPNSEAECPFLNKKKQTSSSSSGNNNNDNDTKQKKLKEKNKKKCPWPFILLHDPREGLKAWQTWLMLGFMLSFLFQTILMYPSTAIATTTTTGTTISTSSPSSSSSSSSSLKNDNTSNNRHSIFFVPRQQLEQSSPKEPNQPKQQSRRFPFFFQRHKK